MRAQQRADRRRSAQTLRDRRKFVNICNILGVQEALQAEQGLSVPSADVMAPNARFKRLFAAISTLGVPSPVTCNTLLRAIPHHGLVGRVIDIGEKPPLSPWTGFAQRHGLGLTAYVPDHNESALELSDQELLLGTARGLRDPKIDAVCLVGLASSPAPIARIVHASGRALILGVRSKFVERALQVADAVVDLDAVTATRSEDAA